MISLPEPAYDLSPLRPGETGDFRQVRKIATFQTFSISVFWHSLTMLTPEPPVLDTMHINFW